MKLSPRDAPAFIAEPDPGRAGILIYGADPMRVALKRQDLIANLIGDEGAAEMRLERMTGADLRDDPARLNDAVKAAGFFPGPRCAFVDEVRDAQAGAVTAALEDWSDGDAMIVVTAGPLRPGSPLRKAFESHRNAFALAVYDDPPGRDEIAAELSRAGLDRIDADAAELLTALARDHDPGEFRHILEKVALYKLGDEAPLNATEVLVNAPLSHDAAIDEALNAAAEGRHDQIGPLVRRLTAQGQQPVSLCIAALRHWRSLHRAASDPGGSSAGMSRLRPPVFGPRRDRMARQAQRWGVARLEQAISVLVDTDLSLRSAGQAPGVAVMERCLIRLAMMGGR